jgi:LuxR family transcriptional regulator, maltose regulon positive regulatory protein
LFLIDPSLNLAAEIPLLETKLYLPRWRSDLVSRPRLVARLGKVVEGRVTLISAPPGFGKTTLLKTFRRSFRYGTGSE